MPSIMHAMFTVSKNALDLPFASMDRLIASFNARMMALRSLFKLQKYTPIPLEISYPNFG